MNPFFAALSTVYVFGIFFWADSPALSRIGEFNPFSLLHIPLYGILTVLLLLAFCSEPKANLKFRFLIAALLATGIAILDEYHQSFIPTRDASVTDVLLDIVGVSLVLVVGHRIPPSFWGTRFKKFIKWTK